MSTYAIICNDMKFFYLLTHVCTASFQVSIKIAVDFLLITKINNKKIEINFNVRFFLVFTYLLFFYFFKIAHTLLVNKKALQLLYNTVIEKR